MAIRKARLPSAYKEVEYIESTGTQYIDTGFYYAQSTTINVKCKIEATTTDEDISVFGCYTTLSTSNGTYYHLTPYANRWYYGTNGTEGSTGNYPATVGSQYVIDFNNNGSIIINGVLLESGKVFQTNGNLQISKRGGTTNRMGKWKYFYFQIYYNGTLVRDYVPCYRVADNEIGLYDMANGVFYTNAGTGTFLKGNDVLPKIVKLYKGTAQIVKRYKGTDLIYSVSRLPSAFQEVEYIQSSGTQYIDTGVSISIGFNNHLAKVKASFVQRNTESYDSIYGIDSNMQFARNSSGYFMDGANVASLMLNLNEIYEYTADYSTGQSSINNVTLTRNLNAGANPFLFCSNSGLLARYSAYAKLYSCQIYDNGTLVRNFVPCYRKADNVAGLYDLVNGVFYTNAGTGTFVVGPDVPSLNYSITYNITNGTAPSEINPTTISPNDTVSITVETNNSYYLSSYSVTGADTGELTGSYDEDTGLTTWSLDISNATGNVVVNVVFTSKANANHYSITNGCNLDMLVTPHDDGIIYENEILQVDFSDNELYYIGSYGGAHNATELQDNGTGGLIISNPTNNVIAFYEEFEQEPEEPTLISFTIDNEPYEAEEGMTWEDWCQSDYNTGGFEISDVYVSLGNDYIDGETPIDVIVEDAEYVLVPFGALD